jgi:hypothetical protein
MDMQKCIIKVVITTQPQEKREVKKAVGIVASYISPEDPPKLVRLIFFPSTSPLDVGCL